MAGGAFDEALAAGTSGDLGATDDGGRNGGVRLDQDVGGEIADEEEGANGVSADLCDERRFAEHFLQVLITSAQIGALEAGGGAPGEKRLLEVRALSVGVRQVERYRLFAVGFAGVAVAAMIAETAA